MEGKFKWTDKLHKAMLDVLLRFKTQCEFNAKVCEDDLPLHSCLFFQQQ